MQSRAGQEHPAYGPAIIMRESGPLFYRVYLFFWPAVGRRIDRSVYRLPSDDGPAPDPALNTNGPFSLILVPDKR